MQTVANARVAETVNPWHPANARVAETVNPWHPANARVTEAVNPWHPGRNPRLRRFSPGVTKREPVFPSDLTVRMPNKHDKVPCTG